MKKNFKIKSRAILTFLLTTAIMMAVATQAAFAEETTPAVTSDKTDYTQGETVILNGSGWSGDESVQLTVDDISGSAVPWQLADTTSVTPEGTFSYQFNLPYLLISEYRVTALGMSTGRSATATFTDTTVDFFQLANGNGIGWIGGALNDNKSDYTEGMSVPQRCVMIGLDTALSSHTASFEYQFTKGGKYAFDFITGWDQAAEAAMDLDGQTWDPAWKWLGLDSALAASLSNVTTASIPETAIAGAKETAYESALGYGNRTFTIYSDAPITVTSVSVGEPVGSLDGDSSSTFTVTWTGAASKVMILYASHIAVGLDTQPASGIGWGSGNGASSISGACHWVLKNHLYLSMKKGRCFAVKAAGYIRTMELDLSFGWGVQTDDGTADCTLSAS